MKYIEHKTVLLNNEEDTRALGHLIADALEPGDVVALIGDLGTGKTALTRYIAEGLGIRSGISSPTFTILHEYSDGRLPLYHFDAYRIDDPAELYEIGYDEYFFGNGVCLIEWPSKIAELIPKNAAVISILRNPRKGSEYRDIIFQTASEASF